MCTLYLKLGHSLLDILYMLIDLLPSLYVLYLQVLNERIENLARQTQEMEGRNQSLQLTVDRLSLTLAKTEEEEANQKVGPG